MEHSQRQEPQRPTAQKRSSFTAPQLRLADVPALEHRRPWYWPFEAKRLETIRALQVALFFLTLTFFARLTIALTLGLSDDEAWYWAIAQKIQLSYAVHPPLAMWLTKLSTTLFGQNILAARLPALLCSTAGAFWLVRLCSRMGWAKGADATAMLCLTTPLLFFGGVLNGPDLPLFVCWIGLMETSFAIGMGYEQEKQAWIKAGSLAALALLSKYTAILGISAAILFIASTSVGRKRLRSRWAILALAIACTGLVPVLAWNAAHDWQSFRFQFISRHTGSELRLSRWGVFWLSQLLLYSPPVLVTWFMLVKRAALVRQNDRERMHLRFLAIWAVVPALVFFVQPLMSAFKIHWALFAFLPVLVYFAKLSIHPGPTRLVYRAVSLGTILTATGVSCFYLPVIPLVSVLAGPGAVAPQADVTSDLYGWSELSSHLQKLAPETRALPLVATRYQIAAQAAFALRDRDRVLLLPQDSAEKSDWGGTKTAPSRFLFVSDTRFEDHAAALFPKHACLPLPDLEVHRGIYIARRILLEKCAARE